MSDEHDMNAQKQEEAMSSLPPVVIGPLDVEEEVAEETPRPLPLPYRKRPMRRQDEDGSRELLLGWCLWLLGSWIILGMGFNGTPIRQMVFASCIGMMIVWPAYRLSQCGRAGDRRRATGDRGQETEEISNLKSQISNPKSEIRNPTASTAAPAAKFQPPSLTPGLIFRDWFALNGVFQAVIWPHLITKHWTLDQAAWVSGSVATWSLLIGAVVAWGCHLRSGIGRTAAMLAVLLLIFAEPVLLMLARNLLPRSASNEAALNWSMHVSPIEALHELTAPSANFSYTGWVMPVICVLLAAVVGWVGVMRMKKN